MEYELNKIYNDDCYKAIKKIPDKSIDLIVTDPPYQIESLKGGGMLKEKRLVGLMDSLGDKNLDVGLDKKILEELIRIMKKVNIYIWCNKKMIPMLFDYFVKQKGLLFDILVWNKTNAVPLCGSKYLTDSEYCLYFRKGGYCNPKSYENAKTVYNLPINMADKNKYSHPTIKPLEIIKNLIINSSNENDVVFDPFMGSGTTAVACKELNRHYIGFELDKEYYEIACDRLKGITQQDKKIIESGQMSLF